MKITSFKALSNFLASTERFFFALGATLKDSGKATFGFAGYIHCVKGKMLCASSESKKSINSFAPSGFLHRFTIPAPST